PRSQQRADRRDRGAVARAHGRGNAWTSNARLTAPGHSRVNTMGTTDGTWNPRPRRVFEPVARFRLAFHIGKRTRNGHGSTLGTKIALVGRLSDNSVRTGA